MTARKLTRIGNAIGVILPKTMLVRLMLQAGDTVYLTETSDGVTLSAYPPTCDDQREAGREFMRAYRKTFRALAK